MSKITKENLTIEYFNIPRCRYMFQIKKAIYLQIQTLKKMKKLIEKYNEIGSYADK